VKEYIDLWANFLMNERLTPQRVDDPMVLVRLCELLAQTGKPIIRPYAKRLLTRRLVCVTAMEHGIDLAGLKFRGKLAMSRGLLDAWNKAYVERYGSWAWA
jgi:hypothetical protein